MVMIDNVIYQVRDSDVVLRGVFKSLHPDIECYSPNSIIVILVNDGILVKDVSIHGIPILRLIDEIPCEICGTPTMMHGTRRCTNCWEVEHRIEEYIKSDKGRQVIEDLLSVHECDMCGKEFCKSDLTIYDGQLLCDDCEEEVKDMEMLMSDVG